MITSAFREIYWPTYRGFLKRPELLFFHLIAFDDIASDPFFFFFINLLQIHYLFLFGSISRVKRLGIGFYESFRAE